MSRETSGTKPFGLIDKIGYMFGDFGNDFTFLLSSTYLMKFYTDVMGVDPIIIGLMMTLARVVDAVTDVTMGQICDRSRPRAKGKFAPWLRRMCGPVAVASFLMYASWFKDMPMGFKIFWMFLTYLLWGSVFYTSINIPYGSMASAISPEAKDRAELSSWRTIGATLANVAIGVVVPLVVYYSDENGNMVLSGSRMTLAALCCSIGAVICYLVCYHLSTERVKIEKVTEKFSFIQLVKSLVGNRALIGIIVAAIMLLLSQLTLSSMGQFIYPNYFGSAAGLYVSNGLSSVVTLLLALVVPRIAGKVGKKELSVFGAFLGAAALFTAYLLHTDSVVVWIVLYMISYMGIAFFNIVCWAMITDVIDDTEVRTGQRTDGTIYSVYSFARKLGQAASSGLSGALLSMIGYTAATAFDPEVLDGIYNITCLIPAVGFVLLALALLFIYPLNKKRVNSNIAYLKEKNAKDAE